MHRSIVVLSSSSLPAQVAARSRSSHWRRRAASSSAKSTPQPTYVVAAAGKDTAVPVPDERIHQPKYTIPPSAFPSSSSAKMYEHFPAAGEEAVEEMRERQKWPSSTATTPAHPATTREGLGRAGHLKKIEGGIGSSSAVRFRSAPGEMSQGGEGGLGLMEKDGGQGDKEQRTVVITRYF